MNDKKITLVICGHENWDYIDYFIEVYREISDIIDFVFVFDNFPGDKNIKKIEAEGIAYLDNFENIGKFKKLFYLDKIIRTDFFKYADYDDLINIEGFKQICEEMKERQSEIHKDSLIVHKGAKVYEGNKLYGTQTTNRDDIEELLNNSKEANWPRVPNAISIHPTSVINKYKDVDFLRQDYFDDDLLSFLSLSLHSNNKGIIFLESRPYIQFHSLGQSKYYNEKYIKSIKTFYQNINLVKDRAKISNMNRSFEENHINWVKNCFDRYELSNNMEYPHKNEAVKEINNLIRELFSTEDKFFNISLNVISVSNNTIAAINKIKRFNLTENEMDNVRILWILKGIDKVEEQYKKEIELLLEQRFDSFFIWNKYNVYDLREKIIKNNIKFDVFEICEFSFINNEFIKQRIDSNKIDNETKRLFNLNVLLEVIK